MNKEITEHFLFFVIVIHISMSSHIAGIVSIWCLVNIQVLASLAFSWYTYPFLGQLKCLMKQAFYLLHKTPLVIDTAVLFLIHQHTRKTKHFAKSLSKYRLYHQH